MAAVAVEDEWYAGITRSGRRASLLGYALILVFMVGFGGWAGTALIAGAVVTSGAFVATGENKQVQSFDGGVIKEILVHEGDRVEVGQPLLMLDETQPKAELRRLQLREARLEAMRVRLQAEAEGKKSFVWPADFKKYNNDRDVQAVLDSQLSTFTARQRNMETDIATLQESINALQERVEAGKIQIANVERQAALYDEEIGTKKMLVSSGLTRKSDLLALQRGFAASSGEIGRLLGEVGDARERIARTKEQINGVYHQAVKTAMEQLDDTVSELQDVRQRIRSAEAVLSRIRVTAPVRGIVVKMRYHTPGGVVEAGRSIMEILPVDENLLIEVRIRPQDIDHVKVGQDATIRLNVMNARSTPMLVGTVAYVSADAITDTSGVNVNADNNRRDAYIARVRLDVSEMQRIPNFHPVAGMPVEVYLKTGERTFFQYITKPVMDSFARAFREI
ncbi:MAG: HlyD family type I secretion periplasmic adaptor subunit [Proteobacteria bacterium]|nr:HlyD family type I secretion periplasmic adaptor subunit [Pseudomonadota bacterium]